MEVFRGQCSKHHVEYDFLINPIDGSQILFCEACNEQQEVAALAAKQRRQALNQQSTLNDALENAMVAPRFRQKTFENYQADTPKQQAAVDAARWFLTQIESGNPANLLLLGSNGTGKNHLATAIVNAYVSQPGRTALFTEALKFLRAVKESWSKGGKAESEVLRLYREPDLLVIDELGVQFGSETESMYLTELINDRYNWLKSTVLIGNLTVKELEGLVGTRALDRLRDNGKMVICDWQSFRGSGNAKKMPFPGNR